LELLLIGALLARADRNSRAGELMSYLVGQGVRLSDSLKSATTVVLQFKAEFLVAVKHFRGCRLSEFAQEAENADQSGD
jgi:hypothetical protein